MKARAALLLLPAIGFFVFWTFRAAPVAFDDAFITFRYSESLIEGRGLSFNPEDGPLEGFTNLSWVLINAGGLALGLEPLNLSQCIGLGALALCVFLIIWAPRLTPLSVLAALAISIGALHIEGLVAIAGSGLETSFAGLLTVVIAVLIERPRPSLTAIWLVGSLLALTRPDGAIFLMAAAIATIPQPTLEQRTAWRPYLLLSLRRAALFSAPLLAIELFRILYFHDHLPNTAYAKSADVSSWAAGWAYWGGLARHAPLLPGVVVMVIAIKLLTRRMRAVETYAVISLSLYVVYVARVGGDFMHYRFAFQVAPLVLFVGVTSIASLEWKPQLAATVLAVALAVWTFFSPEHLEKHFGMQSIWTMGTFVPLGTDAGRALRKNLPPDTRISTTLAGTVPWESKLFSVDEWGLNDRHIAHAPSVPIPENGRGHMKRASAEYLDARGVNLEVSHPVIVDCDRIEPEPFPAVYVRLDDPRRCLRTTYRTPRADLTERFCRDDAFVVRFVDCNPRPLHLTWSNAKEAASAMVETRGRSIELEPSALLAAASGVAFGSAPTVSSLRGQSALSDHVGPVLNSFHGGDLTTGSIDFKLPAGTSAVRFRIGGGGPDRDVFVGIANGTEVVSFVHGDGSERLKPVHLEIPAGIAEPRLVLVDADKRGWGHLLVSDVTILAEE